MKEKRELSMTGPIRIGAVAFAPSLARLRGFAKRLAFGFARNNRS